MCYKALHFNQILAEERWGNHSKGIASDMVLTSQWKNLLRVKNQWVVLVKNVHFRLFEISPFLAWIHKKQTHISFEIRSLEVLLYSSALLQTSINP